MQGYALWLFVGGVFALHFLPLLLNGRHAYVRIHDNLEGEWAWLMLLVKFGKALAFSPQAFLPQILGGQPRTVMPTGLSVNVLLIWLFGGLNGYKASYLLARLLAFWGMYRLLRAYFLPEDSHAFLRAGVALCFSLVPFYLQFGVAVQPFLLHSLLNLLRRKDTWTDWVCLLLIPFYSSIVWMGTSAVIVAGFLWLSWSAWKRRLRYKPMLGVGLLALSYAVVNLPLLQLYLDRAFVSHRKSYDALAMFDINLYASLLEAVFLCTISHYHVGIVVALPLLIAASTVLFKALSRADSGVSRYRALQLALCLFIIAVFSLMYGLYPYIAAPLDDFFPLLSQLRLNRMIIFLPLLFFLAFALTLSLMKQRGFSPSAVATLLGCQLVMGFFANDEWLHNMRRLVGVPVKPGYADFWAKGLFQRIAAHIGKPQHTYRVASLGIHPVVAQYNGFYSLDGLLPLYSLAHKQRFRPIIADEIAKDPRLLAYFDEWGNRCYLFSAELGLSDQNYLIGKDQRVVLKDFRFNAEAFRQAGGQYVLSAVVIENAEQIGLRLLTLFEPQPGEASWWKVYLYEVP
ncbi:MAG: DUF6044 family protein [Saprospiraceae bacterium]|nr:DUF6044 family protein [Saprospiraceae bacterium]MDW8230926.1 DUF6044 family protein [Saprospiraceae bacterium]